MTGVGRVVAAETVKLATVRSYRWALLAGAAGIVAMAAGLGAATGGRSGSVWNPDPVLLPLEYLAYVVMVLGVLLATGEVSAGTADLTSWLVPRRSRAMLGKYVAVGAAAALVALVVGPLVLLGSWLAGADSPAAALSAGSAGPTLAGVAVVPVAAVLGVAFGLLLRSTAAALSLLLVWSFLAETVLVFVLPESVGAWLPFKTIGSSRVLMDQFGPWEGAAVFALWTAALVVLTAAVRNPSLRPAPAAAEVAT